MATQATRIHQVHPWGTRGQAAPRRRTARSLRVLPGRMARDVAGGLLVLASVAGLWGWFLAATW